MTEFLLLSWSGAYKSYVKRSFVIGKFKYTFKKNVDEELIDRTKSLSFLGKNIIKTFLRTNSYIETARLMDISIDVLKEEILKAIKSLGRARSLYLKRKPFKYNENNCNYDFNNKIRTRTGEYKKPLIDELRLYPRGFRTRAKKFLNPLRNKIMELLLITNSYSRTAKQLGITPKKVRNELVGIIKLLKKIKKVKTDL